ncbi:MAG: hypothetical protein WKF85_08020 [Chitinophagaceae bacterium]
MRKIIFALAVTLLLAACDDSKTSTDSTTTDSTNVIVDTTAITPVVVDSTAAIGSDKNTTSKDTASKKY